MDTATAQKILQNYGAPITPQNMNAVMRESGNQSALLGRSMGLQGGASEEGYDDSILKSRLSKLAGDTPATTDTTSTVENPSKNTPASIADVSKTYPSKSNVSSQSGSRGTAPNTEPSSNSNVASIPAPIGANPQTYYGSETATPDGMNGVASGNPSSPNIPEWLIALLGLGAARNTGGPSSAPPISAAPQLTGPDANNPRLTYQPKLNGPGDVPTMPSGAPDNAANMPQQQQRISGPMSIAPEGTIPPNMDANASTSRVRKEPIRPTFSPQEELTQALMNFRKMFRK